MRQLNTWPRSLLRLPLTLRLAIVGGTITLCLLFFVLSFNTTRNGYILAIAAILSAWVFKKKGLYIFVGLAIGVSAIHRTVLLHGQAWPFPFTLYYIGGFILLTIFGYIVVGLRNVLDTAEEVSLRAREAERQTAIAYEQQRQLNELKNQFILNVNHELRSPLTVISGYLSLLLDKRAYFSDGEQERYLKSAMRSCKELQLLTDDVLDTLVLSGDAKHLQTEDIPIADLAHTTVEHFESTWGQKRSVHFDIQEQVMVKGNVQCISHILRNLLSNAYKYSPSEKPVTISAQSDFSSTSEVCISVKDEGPGIPPDQVPLLFGQFVRLQRDLAGPVRGSGLGLYISKNLVEAMGGHIWVESAGIAGEGSRFCFTLPTTKATAS